jgi:hypothetical protein
MKEWFIAQIKVIELFSVNERAVIERYEKWTLPGLMKEWYTL